MIGGLEYQELNFASRGVAWWRTVLGTALLGFLFLLLPVFLVVPFLVALVASGASRSEISDFITLDPVTPGNLAYLNLGIAAAIPATLLVAWLLHGWQRPRWLLSVVGRFRWRWFALCLGLSVVTLTVTVIVSAFLPTDASGEDLGGSLNAFTGQTLGFLLVIALLTPLQAAGEEFVFRGYFTQSWGGWAALRGRRWGQVVAVLVPAFLFALAHGGQDIPVFFDRFGFGVVAGVLVILTGGLEAGLAMHVLNNFVAFGFALAFGDMTDTLNASSSSWWMIITTLTQSLVYLALVSWSARRLGIARRTVDDPVLESSPAPL